MESVGIAVRANRLDCATVGWTATAGTEVISGSTCCYFAVVGRIRDFSYQHHKLTVLGGLVLLLFGFFSPNSVPVYERFG